MFASQRDPAREIERARSAFWHIHCPENRDDWWKVLGSAIAEGISDDDLLSWCSSGPNFNEADARATIRSLERRGSSGNGSLFKLAREQGWTDPTTNAHHTRTEAPKRAPDPLPQSGKGKAAGPDPLAVYSRLPLATEGHGYLTRKGMTPDGLKTADDAIRIAGQECAGWLAVPAWNFAGLQSIQFLSPEANPPEGAKKKLNLPGCPTSGGLFVVHPDAPDGRPTDEAFAGGVVFVAEGIATAFSAYQATGTAAVCSFGKHNLDAVARAIREHHPAVKVIVCPDKGAEHQAAEIARSLGANAAWVQLPDDLPSNFDLNDYAAQFGSDELAELLTNERTAPASEPEATQTAAPGPWTLPLPIGETEWQTARLTPDTLVHEYLYADVAVMVAAGGVGKTSLKLFEAIHIALARPLYGLTVEKPGPVLILTAEDSREMLVARLRKIASEMDLTHDERRIVREQVRISDVSGTGLKITRVADDVVALNDTVDQLIEGCRTFKPVLIVIDPAVSFGVGEARVNDAEQGLIEAGRKLRNALNCCVQFIHHSGKANARDKAVDQYAGRGGSAFADGARMVHVLAPLTPAEWLQETGDTLQAGETGLILARPKMSYCPPQPPLFIKRKGYRYEAVTAAAADPEAATRERAFKLLEIIRAECNQGRYPTRNTLEHMELGMSRAQFRGAIGWLYSRNLIEERDRPNPPSKGARTYLHASETTGEAMANRPQKEPENPPGFASEKPPVASPPPIGKSMAANRRPPFDPLFPDGSPATSGEAMANRRSDTEETPRPGWADGLDVL